LGSWFTKGGHRINMTPEGTTFDGMGVFHMDCAAGAKAGIQIP
jgi:hypothetical protein